MHLVMNDPLSKHLGSKLFRLVQAVLELAPGVVQTWDSVPADCIAQMPLQDFMLTQRYHAISIDTHRIPLAGDNQFLYIIIINCLTASAQ